MKDKERTIRFIVQRFDPAIDSEPYFREYQVPMKKGQTILDMLYWVLEEQDPTLSFRSCCRAGVCGSCASFINGSYRLACETQALSLKSDRITILPLQHLPIIKDLVVDMTPFWKNYELIKPFLMPGEKLSEQEILQSPKDRKLVNKLIDCILCGSCYASCPMTWITNEYIGPAALLKSYRFIVDSRDRMTKERVRFCGGEFGAMRCHTVFNCAEACPQKIDITSTIQGIKRKMILQKLRFWDKG